MADRIVVTANEGLEALVRGVSARRAGLTKELNDLLALRLELIRRDAVALEDDGRHLGAFDSSPGCFGWGWGGKDSCAVMLAYFPIDEAGEESNLWNVCYGELNGDCFPTVRQVLDWLGTIGRNGCSMVECECIPGGYDEDACIGCEACWAADEARKEDKQARDEARMAALREQEAGNYWAQQAERVDSPDGSSYTMPSIELVEPVTLDTKGRQAPAYLAGYAETLERRLAELERKVSQLASVVERVTEG